MKKLCLLLALLLLFSGCGKQAEVAQPTLPTAAPAKQDNPLVYFDIYAINDLHGRLLDTEQQPGADELSGYLKQATETGNTILLSTGDMWQGTAESASTGGLIVTEWMNALGFTAMTLGGHEYDWGEEQLRQNQELAAFPFLGINVYSRLTDQRVDYCQSSVTVDIDGVQVGIIGAIGDNYHAISMEHTQDVYFKTGEALTALVKAEAENLRSRGADFIIYTIHDGCAETTSAPTPVSDETLSGYYDIALSQGFVDLVFEADSHYTYTLTDCHGVYHLQAGGNNTGISHARVMIDRSTGDVYVMAAEVIPSVKYSAVEADSIVEQLLEKYQVQTSHVLGSNSRYRSGDDLCQLVAQLYCAMGVTQWGDAYDIVLGGGYLSCRSPGYLPEGDVTYSQLQSLLPFDNAITLCSIRGRDLISRFLETDLKAYHIHTTPYGDSILGSIDPDGVYYVVTDTYTAYYSYNNLTVVDTYGDSIFARDLVADYIRSGNMEN